MLKYYLLALSLILTVNETNAKPRNSLSDSDAVIGKINKYAKSHKIKNLKDVPYSVMADAIRKQLEKHVDDPSNVTDNKYFALLEEVANEIMPSDN